MGIASTLVGSDTKPLPLCLLAVTWSRLVGPLTVKGGSLLAANGTHVDGASDLLRGLQVPGMFCKDLLTEGGDGNDIDASESAAIDGMATIKDVSGLVGTNNVNACVAMADLWEKCRKTNLWTSAQIDRAKAACLLGVLCFIGTAKEIANVAPDLDPALRAPVITDANRAAYSAIADKFKAIRSTYSSRQYAAAVQAAKDAAADVAFWDTVYDVTKAVADAPATVVGAVGDATLSFAGGFLARTWYLWIIAGVVAFAWFNKGAIAAKVNDKAKAALGLGNAAAG